MALSATSRFDSFPQPGHVDVTPHLRIMLTFDPTSSCGRLCPSTANRSSNCVSSSASALSAGRTGYFSGTRARLVQTSAAPVPESVLPRISVSSEPPRQRPGPWHWTSYWHNSTSSVISKTCSLSSFLGWTRSCICDATVGPSLPHLRSRSRQLSAIIGPSPL